MSRTFKGVLALAAAFACYQAVALASGSSLPSTSAASATMSPEERAVEAYNSGIEHKDKGKKFEDQAGAKQGNEAAKLLDKARGEFEKSLKDFKNAAQYSPKLFQAYNGMGYAYRKTGNFADALAMYDKAIGMAPGFYAEAVEYRAEAYLSLNRIDDAKKAYMDLFAADRKQADLLMVAMKDWVAKRQADAAGVDAAALADFSKWVGERGEMAKQSELMAISSASSRW
jgi:tetratricopeptide (TPR) repeat protein